MAKGKPKSAKHYLQVAEGHLERVREAGDDEVDWSDLATYGLYCLESLVHAATLKIGGSRVRTHWEKIKLAKALQKQHSLPDIGDLMDDLNSARKALAYGDDEFDEFQFDSGEVVQQIEDYFTKVKVSTLVHKK